MLRGTFFFSSRRRHTRWPRDWSSDVCSSDLGLPLAGFHNLTDEETQHLGPFAVVGGTVIFHLLAIIGDYLIEHFFQGASVGLLLELAGIEDGVGIDFSLCPGFYNVVIHSDVTCSVRQS